MQSVRLATVALQDDGTDLVFSVRPHGATEFTELGRTASTGAAALRPFARAVDVPAGGEIGFDDPVIEDAADAAPSVDSLRAQILDAIAATLAVGGPLTGDTPDVASATDRLNAADARVLRAMQTAEALLPPPGKRKAKTGPKPAFGKLRAAARRLGVVRKKLTKGKSATVVGKQLARALKLEANALQRLGEAE
jgi:hypothetical protein